MTGIDYSPIEPVPPVQITCKPVPGPKSHLRKTLPKTAIHAGLIRAADAHWLVANQKLIRPANESYPTLELPLSHDFARGTFIGNILIQYLPEPALVTSERGAKESLACGFRGLGVAGWAFKRRACGTPLHKYYLHSWITLFRDHTFVRVKLDPTRKQQAAGPLCSP